MSEGLKFINHFLAKSYPCRYERAISISSGLFDLVPLEFDIEIQSDGVVGWEDLVQ